MASPFRLTLPTRAVLEELATASPDDPTWGLRICRQTRLTPGTVYPILGRLLRAAWTRAWDEQWDEEQEAPRRGRRRFHRLTPHGRAEMAVALAARDHRENRILGVPR